MVCMDPSSLQECLKTALILYQSYFIIHTVRNMTQNLFLNQKSNSCIDCFSTDLSHRAERTRSCGCVAGSGTLQPPATATCDGSASELVVCTDNSNTKCCPVYGLWSNWECTECIKPLYDEVTKKCSRAQDSNDKKTRERECFEPNYTGKQVSCLT